MYIFIYLETRATSSESLSQLLNSKNDSKSHVPSYTSKEKNYRWKCDSNPKLLLLPVIKQSFGLKMERYKHTFCRKRKQVMTAAIAHWPSVLPLTILRSSFRIPSTTSTLFKLFICHFRLESEKNESIQKEAGIGLI